MTRRRRALFGGSFDPVHCGHLMVAQQVLELEGLDEIVFVPAGRSPHKSRVAASARHRLAMLRLARRSNAAFRISDFELARRGPSYTIDTVRHFAALWGERPRLLLGGDALLDLPSWRESAALGREARFIVYARPGAETAAARARALGAPYHDVGLSSLSSRDLRRSLRRGASLRYQIPDAVRAYIGRHGLYGARRRARS
jgi:nicotinate-nucleotide adenylyltransferase